MTKYTTTLNRIRAFGPCGIDPRKKPLEGFQKLKSFLGQDYGDDTPIPYVVIAQSNGIDDALWCCRAEPQYGREWRLYAVWCARQVEHLMTDHRSKDALDAAENFANGEASQEELAAAGAAARAAAGDAAGDAAWAAARAAARDAAGDAARAAARAAARDAAGDAARAAARDAAGAAAWAAAWDDAWDDARDDAGAAARAAARAAPRAAQLTKFIEIFA
jgi:hypothetical protein